MIEYQAFIQKAEKWDENETICSTYHVTHVFLKENCDVIHEADYF
jgi:hypothetical protein